MATELDLTRCSCGARLIAWRYVTREDTPDMLFQGGSDIVEGDGELQTRSALICESCDGTTRWPGMGMFGRRKDAAR